MPTEPGRENVDTLPWAHLRLPPFPQVAIRVLQLAHSESVQLHQLSELISSDPAFASEVLTVANSALYAPRYPSNSILQAIAVLGANTLQGMCITVGVRAYLGKSMSHPSMQSLWRHNLACAILAERMASVGFLDKDTAYTCGILHDIGRIALAVIQPKDYANLLGTHRGTPESILEGERQLFGWDHCETGQRLIGEWKLPAALEAIVSAHHCDTRKDGAWDMPELIKISCKMADAVGFPTFPGCETTPYQELLDQVPARERRLFSADLATLTQEVTNSIHAIESV
ncbi:MAG TPA: HDOD domain-containing protein [Terracidiphilus sp.]|nr:HDOD domain-containing protein [Terracidiphilus sp.]